MFKNNMTYKEAMKLVADGALVKLPMVVSTEGSWSNSCGFDDLDVIKAVDEEGDIHFFVA